MAVLDVKPQGAYPLVCLACYFLCGAKPLPVRPFWLVLDAISLYWHFPDMLVLLQAVNLPNLLLPTRISLNLHPALDSLVEVWPQKMWACMSIFTSPCLFAFPLGTQPFLQL